MSAFLGGFAKSLSNSIGEDVARKKDDKQWEDRQKKLMELEKQRIAKVEYGQGPNGVTAQPVNAAGEPVGPPRPATEIETQRFQNGETERILGQKKTQAELDQATESTELAKARRANIPIENKLQQQQADSYRMTAEAQAASMRNAGANNDLDREYKEAQIKRMNLENGLLESGKPLPGRSGQPREDLTDDELIKYNDKAYEMAQEMSDNGTPLTEEELATLATITDPRQRYNALIALRARRAGTKVPTAGTSSQATSTGLEALLAASRSR